MQDFTFPCWTSWGSCLPISPVYWGLSGQGPSGIRATPPSFVSTHKLGEGALCPIIQVINKYAKWYWPQYWPLGYTTSNWPLDGLDATNYKPLSPSVLAFSPPLCPLAWSVLDQSVIGDATGGRVKGLAEDKQHPQLSSHPLSQSSHCRRLSGW